MASIHTQPFGFADKYDRFKEREVQLTRADLLREHIDKLCDGSSMPPGIPWSDTQFQQMVQERMWRLAADAKRWEAVKEIAVGIVAAVR